MINVTLAPHQWSTRFDKTMDAYSLVALFCPSEIDWPTYVSMHINVIILERQNILKIMIPSIIYLFVFHLFISIEGTWVKWQPTCFCLLSDSIKPCPEPTWAWEMSRCLNFQKVEFKKLLYRSSLIDDAVWYICDAMVVVGIAFYFIGADNYPKSQETGAKEQN